MALIYAAAERNKQSILDVLRRLLPVDKRVTLMEIASGSGQHTAAFAQAFAQCTFQPSEYDHKLLPSIDAHCKGLANVLPAVQFDVSSSASREGVKPIDYIYCANMIHISSNAAVDGLFAFAGRSVKEAMITYGPYAIDGKITPASNIDFDKSLRARNPEYGYRDTRELKVLAEKNGLLLEEMIPMPANNHTLVWRKK